jgi:hypothetical protein
MDLGGIMLPCPSARSSPIGEGEGAATSTAGRSSRHRLRSRLSLGRVAGVGVDSERNELRMSSDLSNTEL